MAAHPSTPGDARNPRARIIATIPVMMIAVMLRGLRAPAKSP
jgi:hypothetical protein